MKKITTIIWCFIDGKKGHENQSVGLINQLESKVKCITCIGNSIQSYICFAGPVPWGTGPAYTAVGPQGQNIQQ